MNPFDQQLAAARRRQKITILAGMISVILFVAALGAFLAVSKGTAFVIRPVAIAPQTEVSVVAGTAFIFQDKLYALTRNPTVSFTAPHYKPLTTQVPEDLEGKSLEVVLEPLPARIAAAPTPAHAETKWYLDGAILEIGAQLVHEVRPGTYQLKMDHPYFRPEEVSLTLGPGEDLVFEPKMEPHRPWFSVETEEDGAQVIVNGLYIGDTPLETQMAAGLHEILIERKGYQPIRDQVEMTNRDEFVAREYRMLPKSAAVTVNVRPKGGFLLIDGKKQPAGQRIDLASGKQHDIHYSLPGYREHQSTFTLKEDEHKTLSISLEAQTARLKVRATPVAEVFVNDKPRGQTPLDLDLLEKRYTVTLRKKGYRSKEVKVALSANAPTLIEETLLPEHAARLAEAPAQYVNAGGQTMKLFHPDSFTMGAPRSEPGQRANEFLRDVQLTKPFYASLHEVSIGQYAHFRKPPKAANENLPVTSVSWLEAAEYANWLSGEENLSPVYRIRNGRYQGFDPKADGYRLLTEAEWEWLARKANRKKQTIFSWGDATTIPAGVGNIADESARGTVPTYVPRYTDGFAVTAPVGSFAVEPSGLFDLAGNVSEWVHDYYSLSPPRPGDRFVDPMGPTSGESHIYKGASYKSGTRTKLRPAYRDGAVQGRDDIGFRVARYLIGGSHAN